MQRSQSAKKSTVSRRRSDLVVCPVRQSSSRRRSTDECPTPDDVSKTRKNFLNLEIIQSTWDVSKTCFLSSAQDVLVRQAATYVFLIRKWKRRTRATDTWPNIWQWHITAFEVWLASAIRNAGAIWKNVNNMSRKRGTDIENSIYRHCSHTALMLYRGRQKPAEVCI